MRSIVVGAGPIGLFMAVGLARAGHEVTVVDRDAGPAADGTWERKGVMQFRHPHFFRNIVSDVFTATAPDLWDAVVAAGGVPCHPEGAPPFMVNLQCRRSVFEAAVRGVAAHEPGVTLVRGHADRLEQSGGRVRAVVVDGRSIKTDVVIDASGRSGRLGDELRAPIEGGACGFAYVSRMYRARPGGSALPETSPPRSALYDGYLCILFPQDDNTLSTLIVRADDDRELSELRHPARFDAAMRAIPLFAPWTDPERFEPISGVLPGGGLTNTYRGQLTVEGSPALPGVFWVGDAVCTTNPAAGRGVSLGLRQASMLLALLAEHGADHAAGALAFDAWCAENIRPWFEDHVHWDTTLLRRFRGQDLDLDAKIPSDVVCAIGTEVDPALMPGVGPYMGMLALPAVLDPFQERAREVLRSGWRPPLADGPGRGELIELTAAASAGAGAAALR
jgi:2-polyprenyl-6-methoxyphenol hydroxylase-like FAD-dependent oxidoreductase